MFIPLDCIVFRLTWELFHPGDITPFIEIICLDLSSLRIIE